MNFEKVNPNHPDKIADRIAGALVDIAYRHQTQPSVAVEVLIGHNKCNIIAETSYNYTEDEVKAVVDRLAGEDCQLNLVVVPQDEHLANNHSFLRCGDNGIFKGEPVNSIEKRLTMIAHTLYDAYNSDGKYIMTDDKLIICQSKASLLGIKDLIREVNKQIIINPLGYWTGGINVDCGATNRKLGSDMGRAVTGGGLHGKDLSKADVSVNIACHILAQRYDMTIQAECAIGD